MGIKDFLQKRVIQRTDQKNVRQKQMKNLSEIRSVLILATFENLVEYDKWKQYYKNMAHEKQKINLLAYVHNKLDESKINGTSENIIFPSHLAFTGMLKRGNSIDHIIHQKYDLVIDMNFNQVFILNWAFVKIKSLLRVGAEINSFMELYYDLKIKTKDALKQPKLFVDQVFYYLEKINTNGNK